MTKSGGAAETVTGSRYLIETDRARVLVDCGLFQGYKKLRERNWTELPFPSADLPARFGIPAGGRRLHACALGDET